MTFFAKEIEVTLPFLYLLGTPPIYPIGQLPSPPGPSTVPMYQGVNKTVGSMLKAVLIFIKKRKLQENLVS